MRVLIIKLDDLCEVIQALPVLDYLHKVCKGISIDWLVDASCAEVLSEHPLVNRIIAADLMQWRSRPLCRGTLDGVRDIRSRLASGKYDIVFDLQGSLLSGMASRATGAAKRFGYDRDALQEPVNRFFSTRQIPLRRDDFHATDQCLRLVSIPFGRDYRDIPISADIATSDEDDRAAHALISTLSDGLVFVFDVTDNGIAATGWSMEGWKALSRMVRERFPDASIILPWRSEADRAHAADLTRETKGRLVPLHSLKETAALLKRVDLVVGADAPLVHLASAVGTPTVSFYRSTDSRRTGPRGSAHELVQSPLGCTKCFRTRCDSDERCRASITPDNLFSGIVRLFG